MPEVLIGGVRLHAVVLGEGPPAVLVHGLLLGNLSTLLFGLGARLAVQRRVLGADLRGHGRSERTASGYDVGTLAEDLRGLRAALGLGGPAWLVGHSYGALVALEHARRCPEEVERLVLIEPPLAAGDLDELMAFLRQPAEAMWAALPEGLRDGGRRGRRQLEAILALGTQTDLLATLARRPAAPLELIAALGSRCAFVFGEDSPCRRMVGALPPEAPVRLLPGGHFLPHEQPARLQAAVLELLGVADG